MNVVGRDQELRSLHAFLDRPPAGEIPTLVLEGEAGIGKSTLWLEGVECARSRGFRVLSSRPAQAELGLAHAGLGDLLEDALAEVAAELAAPRRSALESALLLQGVGEARVDPRALAVAVRSTLHLLADREPVLVAIDDVQWLDASSVRALAFALRRLHDSNIRLLCTRRLEHDVAASALELAVAGSVIKHLPVGPLSLGALHSLLQARLGRVFARPTLLRVHEGSGGNPFFALELAGALDKVVDPAQPLPVPVSLQVLVRDRLDRLPAHTQASLLLASAHGRIKVSQLDGDALRSAFAEDVIEVVDGAVRFTHPLLASVLYQGASAEARRETHSRLAELVEDPVASARHRVLAADRADAGLAAALEQAADIALARGAPIVAAELSEHALSSTPAAAGEDRHRRSLMAARAGLASGDGRRAEAIALELLAASPPGDARAEALVLLAEIGPLDRIVTSLEEALREEGVCPALQSLIHQRVARAGRLIKGREWAAQHARAALDIATRIGDDTLEVGALSALASLRFDMGDADAPQMAEQAYELAVAIGDPELLKEASIGLAHVLVWSVRTDQARAFLEAREREWHDRDEGMSAEALWFLTFVELRAGRWSLAAEYAERARELGLQYSSDDSEVPQLAYAIALVAAYRGDIERARAYATLGCDRAAAQGALLAGLVSLPGRLDLWSGDATSAVVHFATAERQADTAGWGEPNLRPWRADYVEALLELGRTQDAVTLLDIWEEAAVRVGRTWVLAQVTRCRGLVAAARGDVEDALSLLERATIEHDAAGDPFGRARALLALGVIRRRARQKRPAREAIDAAIAGFETLGAAGWVDKARAELGQIGGRTQSSRLTAAELRVAKLVAAGKTNREVAAALFLGERTVGGHLTRIYAKLGVRSRTELARKVETF